MDDPRAAENVPAGQALQFVERAGNADAVPRAQGMQDAAPDTGEKEPGVHGPHKEEVAAPMTDDEVPTGHLKHAVALAFA